MGMVETMEKMHHTYVRALIVASVAVLGITVPASAQSVGVRAGASGSPDQFYVGAHAEAGPVVEDLLFRPNLEIGIGNDITLVAVNLEFVYPFPLGDTEWRFYPGAGPALNIYRFNERTKTEGGFNILLGLEHEDGFMLELKVGALDSPDVKFGIGYTWRP